MYDRPLLFICFLFLFAVVLLFLFTFCHFSSSPNPNDLCAQRKRRLVFFSRSFSNIYISRYLPTFQFLYSLYNMWHRTIATKLYNQNSTEENQIDVLEQNFGFTFFDWHGKQAGALLWRVAERNKGLCSAFKTMSPSRLEFMALVFSRWHKMLLRFGLQ